MNDHARLVNRHPVDQLAQIREQIRALKDFEASLAKEVSGMMGERDSLGGDEYIARQTISTRKGSIDQKRMAEDGIDVDRYRKEAVNVFSIRVEQREREAV